MAIYLEDGFGQRWQANTIVFSGAPIQETEDGLPLINLLEGEVYTGGGGSGCPLFCGPGSPEGVVSSPQGGIYEQTDAPTGANPLWVKRESAGLMNVVVNPDFADQSGYSETLYEEHPAPTLPEHYTQGQLQDTADYVGYWQVAWNSSTNAGSIVVDKNYTAAYLTGSNSLRVTAPSTYLGRIWVGQEFYDLQPGLEYYFRVVLKDVDGVFSVEAGAASYETTVSAASFPADGSGWRSVSGTFTVPDNDTDPDGHRLGYIEVTRAGTYYDGASAMDLIIDSMAIVPAGAADDTTELADLVAGTSDKIGWRRQGGFAGDSYYSIAMGDDAEAGSGDTIAIGRDAVVLPYDYVDIWGVAIGNNSLSEHAGGTVVVGDNARTIDYGHWRGMYSVAVGQYCDVGGDCCVTIGYDAHCYHNYQVAIGTHARSWRPWDIALGRYSIASGDFAIAVGPRAEAIGKASMAFGWAAYTDTPNQVVFGCNGNNTGTHGQDAYVSEFVFNNLDFTSATSTTYPGRTVTVRGTQANGTNQAGGDIIVRGGPGTGSGVAGGVQIQTANRESSGITWQESYDTKFRVSDTITSVEQSFALPILQVSGDYTATKDDHTLVYVGAGDAVITLPDIADSTSNGATRQYTIKRGLGTGNLIVSGTSAQPIDNAGTLVLSGAQMVYTVQADPDDDQWVITAGTGGGGGSGGGAPVDAQYLTLAAHNDLTHERTLVVQGVNIGVTMTDGGPGGNYTIVLSGAASDESTGGNTATAPLYFGPLDSAGGTNSAAYKTKGVLWVPPENFQVDAVTIVTADTGTYYATLVQLNAGTTQVGAPLAVSEEVTTTASTPRLVVLPFTNPVLVTSGQRYGLLVTDDTDTTLIVHTAAANDSYDDDRSGITRTYLRNTGSSLINGTVYDSAVTTTQFCIGFRVRGAVQGAFELDELVDVTITDPVDNHGLVYSGDTWINAPTVTLAGRAAGDMLYVTTPSSVPTATWLTRPVDYASRRYRLELDPTTGVPTWATRTLSAQFTFDTTDAAGARRFIQVPHAWAVTGWLLRARNSSGAATAATATFAIEKAEWGGSPTDIIGTGTAPALSAASDARDTDGTLDWSGDLTGDADSELLVELDTVTWGSATQLVLTLKLEER